MQVYTAPLPQVAESVRDAGRQASFFGASLSTTAKLWRGRRSEADALSSSLDCASKGKTKKAFAMDSGAEARQK